VCACRPNANLSNERVGAIGVFRESSRNYSLTLMISSDRKICRLSLILKYNFSNFRQIVFRDQEKVLMKISKQSAKSTNVISNNHYWADKDWVITHKLAGSSLFNTVFFICLKIDFLKLHCMNSYMPIAMLFFIMHSDLLHLQLMLS
jgi:hypothetical protein